MVVDALNLSFVGFAKRAYTNSCEIVCKYMNIDQSRYDDTKDRAILKLAR